jgi:hypothetical protein
MTVDINKPPLDVFGVLQGAARFLDLLDEAIAVLAKLQGKTYEPGTTAQDDLLALAAWFGEHPEYAGQATAAVCRREGRE